MAENNIVGYKTVFGFVLPGWVDESTVRSVVTLLLSSTAMLFVLIFVIWPKFLTIDEMRSSLKSGEGALDALKSSKAGLDKLNEQIPESVQNIILSAIPTTYSPENAVFMLRKIGNEVPGLSIVSYKLPSGVLYEIKETTLGKSKESEGMVSFISYPIRLTVTAPVGALLEFINKVETSLPFGVVSDLGLQEVSKLAKTATTRSIQMEIEVRYYQAELKAVDIAKIKPISEAELSLVKKISGFSKVGVVDIDTTGDVPATISSPDTLFGF